MKHYKGIMYFCGVGGRWFANHHRARNSGYESEYALKKMIDAWEKQE